MEKKKTNGFREYLPITILAVVIVIACLIAVYIFAIKDFKKNNKEVKISENVPVLDGKNYKLSDHGLSNFDLVFLQLNNKKENVVYSPLSIKYALGMLSEGTDGKTKDEISNVLGDFVPTKYNNNEHMSFANALFVETHYGKFIVDSYINNLKSKYNAEVVYDDFNNPDNVNKWISNKTFNLLNNVIKDVSDTNFIIINALAIDMEWKNDIQPEDESFNASFPHENTPDAYVGSISLAGFSSLNFNNNDVAAVEFVAAANRYDVVGNEGEDNIRTTITQLYSEWLGSNPAYCEFSPTEKEKNDIEIAKFVNKFIETLNSNYGSVKASTDFSFYVDDDVKVFAKELKEYDGTTLEYVAIMPVKEDLDKFIENINKDKINEYINNLKDMTVDNFEDGYVTVIKGSLPLFKYEYQPNLMENLYSLGINEVFTKKADLSKLTTDSEAFITRAGHKAMIEFNNKGIKAAAVTYFMSDTMIASDCFFDYSYDVPVKEFDLTFNKPFIYLIRDKKTGEVWFVGSLYDGILYDEYINNNVN